jgi:hypothetical protein
MVSTMPESSLLNSATSTASGTDTAVMAIAVGIPGVLGGLYALAGRNNNSGTGAKAAKKSVPSKAAVGTKRVGAAGASPSKKAGPNWFNPAPSKAQASTAPKKAFTRQVHSPHCWTCFLN